MDYSEVRKDLILAVDDSSTNLMLIEMIFKGDEDLRLQLANGGEEALLMMEREVPDLILLDMHMPEMSGLDVLEELSQDPVKKSIPVIFVTSDSNRDTMSRAFELGARDYIMKPIDARITRMRVRNHLEWYLAKRRCDKLVVEKTRDAIGAQIDALNIIAEVGHMNDDNTGFHVKRMAKYARAIARGTEFNTDEFEYASWMHDSGKIGVSDTILKKPGSLTADEWVEIKKHTTFGHQMFNHSTRPIFVMSGNIAWCHHERWDGKGYPRGLVGEDIPLEARIVALADVFDALTIKRPYKEPWPVEKAVSVMKGDSGTHFDPSLIPVFLEVLPQILEIKAQFVDEIE